MQRGISGLTAMFDSNTAQAGMLMIGVVAMAHLFMLAGRLLLLYLQTARYRVNFVLLLHRWRRFLSCV